MSDAFPFTAFATRDADAPFLIGAEGRVTTYGELREDVARLRGLLTARRLGPGDSVLLAVGDDREVATLFLALLFHGVTVMVWDARAPAWESLEVLEWARASALILDASAAEAWDEAAYLDLDWPKGVHTTGSPAWQRTLEKAEPVTAPAPWEPESIAYVLFTSGSTGRPKGVQVSRRALAAHLKTLSRHLGYGPRSRLLDPLVLHHTDGLIHGPVCACYNGAAVLRPFTVTLERVGELAALVHQHGVTHFITAPAMLAMLLRVGSAPFDAPAFAAVICSGSHLEEGLWRDAEQRLKCPIVNVYGLTETVVGGLFAGPDDDSRRIGTLGRPVDCQVRLDYPGGFPAERGQAGELLIQGENLMSGYLHDAEATNAVLQDGWLRTGDLVSRGEGGTLMFHGRLKNVLVRGGFNIVPEQIARVLTAHPAVDEAAVVGRPDPNWGDVPVAVVRLRASASASASDLASWCRERLSEHKVPADFVFVDELPRGPAGKVQLDEVRARALDQARISHAEMDDASFVLALAARNFRVPVESLSLESTDRATPGWDSLAFMTFLNDLEESFWVTLEMEDIVAIATLGDALEAVRRRRDG